jgi:hypothetical protein
MGAAFERSKMGPKLVPATERSELIRLLYLVELLLF